jgi:hypothetical protein
MKSTETSHIFPDPDMHASKFLIMARVAFCFFFLLVVVCFLKVAFLKLRNISIEKVENSEK